MKSKIVFLLISLCITTAWSQQLKSGNITFSIPVNFKFEDLSKEKTKAINGKDKEVASYLEMVESLEFNQTKQYFYENKNCGCLNTLQFMTADYGVNFDNSEYGTNKAISSKLLEIYSDIIAENFKQINSMGDKMKAISYTQPEFINSNGVNLIHYTLISEEYSYRKKQKIKFVTENYIVPQKQFFTMFFFHTDNGNISVVKPMISDFLKKIK